MEKILDDALLKLKKELELRLIGVVEFEVNKEASFIQVFICHDYLTVVSEWSFDEIFRYSTEVIVKTIIDEYKTKILHRFLVI